MAYVAVTYDEKGGNLPREVDGNKVEWARIETSHGEIFSLVSTVDMERDLHEGGNPPRGRDSQRPGQNSAARSELNVRIH